MADTSDLSNEQIIALLQMLFTNMNNLDKLYYDMFINTTPLTLTLERYNEEGVLESYELPNRAKDRTSMLQGRGDPEGSQTANIGTTYLDILTSNVWIKVSDGTASGWLKLYTPSNFISGKEYLSPTGDGSGLTGLSASNLQGGILPVANGGTGTAGLTGIIMGRGGSTPYTTAQANIDYLKPELFIGMLGFFMDRAVPTGWVECIGQKVSRADYPLLANILDPKTAGSIGTFPNNMLVLSGTTRSYTDTRTGITYTCDEDEMFIPDFQDKYVRGWTKSNDNTIDAVVGAFQPTALPNVKGKGCLWYTGNAEAYRNKVTGALYVDMETTNDYRDVNDDSTGGNAYPISFDASKYKPTKSGVAQDSIYSNDVYEARVNNLSAHVCIFAGVDS